MSLNRLGRWLLVGLSSVLFAGCAFFKAAPEPEQTSPTMSAGWSPIWSPVAGAATVDQSYFEPAAPSSVETHLATFSDLPGWSSDRLREAISPMRKSCAKVMKQAKGKPLGKTRLGGRAVDWRPFCSELAVRANMSDSQVRDLLKRHLQPHRVVGRGIFTGYYEPVLEGRLKPSAAFPVPLYRLPAAGKTWMKAKGSGPQRSEINRGQGLDLKPLLWLKDPVDTFMLHVQGSGFVRLDKGRRIRVSYEGDNGHAYRSIFPAMQKAGFEKGRSKSLQSMTAWLKENPGKAQAIMNKNPRYIFFSAHKSQGPIGAGGISLTPGRSMAVDTDHIPLGAPLWVDTKAYYRGQMRPVQRLMVAQDVGAAIKGVVRGDLYWGSGEKALEVAGNMKEPGFYYILLPKGLNPQKPL